jgi:hypothetical protein
MICMGILRSERRCCHQGKGGKSDPHAPLSGPMTVTVCIIPPCM